LSKSTRPIVGLDTNIVAWALRDPDDDEPRSQQSLTLLSQLEDRNAIIIIPSIVLSEVLINVEQNQRSRFAANITENFMLANFDAKSAITAANLFSAHRNMVNAGEPGDRRAFKADTMIIASAKTAGVQEFFTHDDRCRELANFIQMDGRNLPEFDENLFRN